MTLITMESVKDALPAHTEQECQLLTDDILRNGCLDAIKTWNGIIVDGYLRYDICLRTGTPFNIEEMEFDSISEAILWRVKSQIGRRNATPFQKCEMVLPLEPAIRAEARKRMLLGVRLNEVSPKSTMKVLADMAGVSHETMRRAKFVHENADHETLRRLRAGEISISFAHSTLTRKPRTPAHPLKDIVDALINRVAEGNITNTEIIAELTNLSERLR